MLQTKADLRYLLCKIALQARDLVGVGENPGSSVQPRGEASAADIHRTYGIAAIAAFFESDLPGWPPSPLTQTFARRLDVFGTMLMKNQHKARRSYGANLIRKSFGARSPVAIFLHVHVPATRLRDRNQVIELSDFWNAQPARAVHMLMF